MDDIGFYVCCNSNYCIKSSAERYEQPCINRQKSRVLTMISRAVDAQKMNFQYTRTGATKIIPPSSLASPFSIIVQLYYNKFVVCYLCFMMSSYFSTLTSSCRETDVKAIFLCIFYDAN